MAPGFLFRPKLALEIARIDPATFNKIVSDGFLDCARRAITGKARPFEENDVVTAFILGRLLDQGMGARQAGPIACEFNAGLKAMPGERVLIWAIGRFGGHLFGESDYKPDWAYNIGNEGYEYTGVTPVVSEIRFNIAAIRKIIAYRVAEEQRTLGVPDDDE